MRALTVTVIGAVVGGLGYIVYDVAEGATDWFVLAGICLGTLLLSVAFHDRVYPSTRRKRSFSRGAESRW